MGLRRARPLANLPPQSHAAGQRVIPPVAPRSRPPHGGVSGQAHAERTGPGNPAALPGGGAREAGKGREELCGPWKIPTARLARDAW
jgi:hypothetical protein